MRGGYVLGADGLRPEAVVDLYMSFMCAMTLIAVLVATETNTGHIAEVSREVSRVPLKAPDPAGPATK